jgi:hypothetical protein
MRYSNERVRFGYSESSVHEKAVWGSTICCGDGISILGDVFAGKLGRYR